MLKAPIPCDQSYRDFAVKWEKEFRRGGTAAALLVDDPNFPKECRDLGFEIDMGERLSASLKEQYVGSYEWMEEHVDSINDAQGLGNAIFSRWRYYNGYAYSSSELDSPGKREWFTLAFDRLKALAEEELERQEEKSF